MQPRAALSDSVQILMTFYPDGTQWGEPTPVLISEGFLSDDAGIPTATTTPLSDSFQVDYTNSSSSSSLRISIARDLDQELVESQRLRAAAMRAAAAGASSGGGQPMGGAAAAAAAAAAATQGLDQLKLSFGGALAQGRTMLLRASVPAWLVNGTQLPVKVGVLAVVDGEGGSREGRNSSGLGGDGGRGSYGNGVGSGTGAGRLRIMETDRVASSVQPLYEVNIMPNSIELLSFPDLPVDTRAGSTPQWAAVLSIMGSRWTAPILLTGGMTAASAAAATAAAAAAAGSAGAAAAAGGGGGVADEAGGFGSERYEPVLVRAKCTDACTHEITARVELDGSGLQRSTVLRLTPHLVVSNRTGYSLNLLQPEPIWKVIAGTVSGGSSGGGSSSSSSSRQLGWDAGGLQQQQYGGAATAGAWFAPSPTPGQGTSPKDQQYPRQQGYSTTSTSSRGALAAVGGSSARRPERDAVMMLRSGSVGVPVSWQPCSVFRQLALMLPQAADGGSGAPLDPLMWSEPFCLQYPATQELQVLLPVYRLGTPGEPQQINEASLAAARRVFDSMSGGAGSSKVVGSSTTAQQQQQLARSPSSSSLGPGKQDQQALDVKDTSKGSSSGSSSGPLFIHLCKQTDGGLQEYLAVVLQLSVEDYSPGCLHLVLQSLGGEPQHLIQNCLDHPLSFRPAHPRAAWLPLPPLSALGLVPPPVAPGGGGVAEVREVEVRDAQPETNGFGLVVLDGGEAGGTRGGDEQGARAQGAGGRAGVVDLKHQEFPVAGGKAIAFAQVGG